jgi:multiple sugar transport system substrate-binding protein
MDEKVLFNPQTPENPENPQAPEAPAVPPPAGQAEGIDQVPADDQTATDDQEVADEGTIEEASPGFLGGVFGGFLGGGLLKKLLIGIGSIILLTIIIIMLIPKGQPDKTVTLQWWGLWEDASTMQSLIIDYKKTHPNVTINYIKNDPSQYLDRLQARLQNGTGPDIFLYHNTWMPMLNGDLSPLSSNVITPDQFKQNFYPVMVQDLSQNGAIYGLPLDADSLALFVNPELFQAAGVQVPATWDDFVKAASQLTVKDPNGKIRTAGAALGTYANINHAPDIISLLFLQQGVQMNKFSDSTKNESDALKFYTAFALGDNKVWDGTLDNSLLAFSKGNLGMYFGFSWDVFAIQKLNPNLNFKIYPVPSLYGKKTTVASYWVNGVSSKSPNQKEAMDFMQYLAQKSTAQKFYSETAKTRAFGEPYARKDLQSSLKENQMVYPFVSQLNDAGSSYFASDTRDGDTGINSMMNTYLQTTVNQVITDNGAADSSVKDLNNGVAQVLQKYGIQQQ